MARVFGYEAHEYRHRARKHKIEKGAVVDLDDDLALRLTTAHPDKLMLLGDDEQPPNIGQEYATTMKVTPDMDRRMIPGRLSRQKQELLRKAKREGRYKAALTITR
jgi:hypothetical protein